MNELVLSLFPGLELLDRAFREEGFCVVAGPDRVLGGDVRDFHPPAGRFDGVIGGSPCQAFSALANLVRAKGLTPRFGNLVPEFERVVEEAQPRWFLHENVPRAPVPAPEGYAVADFELCNSSIEGQDGLGQEQERVRRFTFGVRGEGPAPCLLRWITRAALRLPKLAGGVTQSHVDNSPEAKGRFRTGGVAYELAPGQRVRTAAVLADRRETPVKLGGSGKVKRTRVPPLTGENGVKHETPRVGKRDRARQATITGANPGRRPKGGKSERRSIAEMLRLQGLPEDYLDDAPFTVKGARKLVANGVPMPMGRAVAKAVRQALK